MKLTIEANFSQLKSTTKLIGKCTPGYLNELKQPFYTELAMSQLNFRGHPP
jgi:hypothetical protein